MSKLPAVFLLLLASLSCAGPTPARAATAATPEAAPAPPDEVPAQDYPGTVQLSVDATDIARRLYQVRQRLPVKAGPLKLWYPQWIPGNHAATGPINQFAGLVLSAAGRRLPWRRDPLDVYAFLLDVPDGVSMLDIEFQSLSPTADDQGRVAMTTELLSVQWSRLLLYPAGHDARRIRFEPSLRLPQGWGHGTALRTRETTEDGLVRFEPLALVDLVDSPVYAGRHFKRFVLDGNPRSPVHLNVVADAPELLEAKPEILEAHRALVVQADRLYGNRPFAHYDFLLALSDQFSGIGLEHLQSSENGTFPGYLTGKAPFTDNYLLPHEYAHSWNGKSVRPASLWTPHYNTPMQNDLLWVYEGQTEFWAWVLATRAGLYTAEQSREVLAATAATFEHRAGRRWRNLQDTVYQGIIDFNDAPAAWQDWQRGYDFYDEGVLLWLDVDSRLRELSGGRRSLDAFARGFLGGQAGKGEVRRYDVGDVVQALDRVQAHDWAGYLRERVEGHGAQAPLQGLARSGWRLVYSEVPNAAIADAESDGGFADYRYSLGLKVAADGKISEVLWESPAHAAGIARDMQLVAVDGMAYNAERMNRALAASRSHPAPLQLLVRQGDAYRTLQVPYHGGLRHPHLERLPGSPDRLTQLLAPMK
ncbi:MAG: M61 family peptidase [Lysobacteraceae bacterium]|nr:MAG: M61 family peptidase [Xanthomonadaceae bacterium]